MNNDRFIEDCDEPAIKELHKISLLLESDPDVIEAMPWDELQTEILEQGLDIDRPLLLFTKPPLETFFLDSSLPFRLCPVTQTGLVSTLTSWPLIEVRVNDRDRKLGFLGESQFDGKRVRLDAPDANLKGETITHVWGLSRIEFSSDSINDFLKNMRSDVNVREGAYGPEDLYQDCALKLWKHIQESNIATEVLSKEKEAIEKAEEVFDALNSLMLHPWIQQMVYRVCRTAASQFGLDQEDLVEVLIEKLRTELHNIRYPRHRSFSKALEAWSNSVIQRHCMNLLRHSKVVKRHEELVEHINCGGKRNSVSIERSVVPTPEDELIEKEEAQKWASRALEIRCKVRRIITEDIFIAYRWGQGQKPDQIAREINKSVKTVYRKLGNIQKAVLEEIGIEETEENRVLIKEGMRELFANSLHCRAK